MFIDDPKQIARFWRFVDKSGDCWVWKGNRNKKGYARFPIQQNRILKYLRAYCVSWEMHNSQDWPSGAMACHSCDNPWCVNPEHVRPGSAKDNYIDQLERGRLGSSPPALNVVKTHCVNGHPLEGENLSVRRNGHRACRKCLQAAKARFYQRRKFAA